MAYSAAEAEKKEKTNLSGKDIPACVERNLT